MELRDLKVGDIVIFAEGWDGVRVMGDVRGNAGVYEEVLTRGDRVIAVGNTAVSLACGYTVRPHSLQLKDPGPVKPEIPGEWAARWSKMLEA